MTTPARRDPAAGFAAALAAAALVASSLIAAAPVRASPDHEQENGSCSQGSGHWRLRVSPRAGHLRVTYAISDVRPRQTWQVFVSDNGVRILATSRVSNGRGWFRVRTVTRDRVRADHLIRATAVSTFNGGTCQGSLDY